ncbi:putative cytokinetic ring protein SteA [Halalkalibacterium halodurans]|uniref:putative cytokinetic ring protein SteA n=1 Tax=Halalkalibacterium halodurans TaxID=86665 RepID=UPI002E2432E6|nr:putative cytokinetic ring protein SteA [Halalkalibacterium halodurans]MED4084690.1 putative cytokinetic ring protein SteA [Halalkalibacterium halodurans]MED4103930.1 putative cytokinetic ring protein SteA [Halalkalibacterium halodurans]MED4108998.1 putative cytokinetic ring protein SteA [Halalkalibacterium halodurans]MED4150184.1 putative cytokinetic ring protein SteA [Halalkalibacterium halodurans]
MGRIEGTAYQHRKTKKLLETLPERSIAVISHENLDSLAVEGLLARQVKAIVNLCSTMNGTFRHDFIYQLLQEGIGVYDVAEVLTPNNELELNGKKVLLRERSLFVASEKGYRKVARLQKYDAATIAQINQKADADFAERFTSFFENTWDYAKNEVAYFTEKPMIPDLFNVCKGRQVLIVARYAGFEQDLAVFKKELSKRNIIKIAVDGAADGMIRQGLKPNMIIGDMDSVTEQTLRAIPKRLVHQYINGGAPGLKRLQALGLTAETFPFIGTSEDVAVYLAYWSGAEHLYLVGCRFGYKEFLEKGRSGMAGSLLCRMQAGERITDLKGIHRLYRHHQQEMGSQWMWRLAPVGACSVLLLHPRVAFVISLLWSWVMGGFL